MVTQPEDGGSNSVNQKQVEALTAELAEMKRMMAEQFEAFRLEQENARRARQRKEKELDPKPPDNKTTSTWSNPQKISHTPKSKSAFCSEYHRANELFKFAGKRSYVEWERNMDDWFYYNRIPKEKRIAHAIRQLTGDVYQWWIREVDDRWNYKEPPITSWKELKELMRNKYAPSGEPKQCKSSNFSKSKEVTCYNSRKKGHFAATCPEKHELNITSLGSKLSSQNSSSEVVNQGVETSSSCVMHLVLSKNVDSGHTMEHKDDKAEGSTKEKNPHLMSATSQDSRAHYVSNITIFKAEMLPNILRGTQVSLDCKFIHYWNIFTFTCSFKQPVLNGEVSSIIHLILSLSAKEDT